MIEDAPPVQRVTLSALPLVLAAGFALPALAQTVPTVPDPSFQTAPQQAQPAPTTPATTEYPAPTPDVASGAPQAPDGSAAFGIEPYLGVMGSYASFDNDSIFGNSPTNGSLNSWMVTGIGGINIPLGPLFFGAEGNVSKGFSDIDWTYGVRGRAGLRAGETGMIFGTGGYQWIKVGDNRGFVDQEGWVVGLGVEVGPRDIGLGGVTGRSGPRIRFQVETFEFDSIQPSVGVVFHF